VHGVGSVVRVRVRVCRVCLCMGVCMTCGVCAVCACAWMCAWRVRVCMACACVPVCVCWCACVVCVSFFPFQFQLVMISMNTHLQVIEN
jgi:hypothetical protein